MAQLTRHAPTACPETQKVCEKKGSVACCVLCVVCCAWCVLHECVVFCVCVLCALCALCALCLFCLLCFSAADIECVGFSWRTFRMQGSIVALLARQVPADAADGGCQIPADATDGGTNGVAS